MFSDADTKDIKNLVDVITTETDANDILFDHEPVDVTPNVSSAADPTLDFSDILLPKNKGRNKAAKNFLKTYQKMRQNEDKIKKITNDAIQNMKRLNYLQTDDIETVSYNSDIEPGVLSTVNYNSDVDVDEAYDAKTINYNTTNKSCMTQQQVKRITKKYGDLKRKAPIKINYVAIIVMMTLRLLNKYLYILEIG